jgi:hypothetical protein
MDGINKIGPSANTDNKGKLLVMLFARPADASRTGMTLSYLPGPVLNPAPGFAQLHAIKFPHLD